MEIQTKTVLPVKKNAAGFRETGTVFGTYSQKEESKTQEEFKKLEEVKLPEKPAKNLFDLKPEKAAEFLPLKGKALEIQSQIEYTDIEYSLYQAKRILVDKLNRRLRPDELEIISGFNKTIFTESDIETILSQLKEKENQRRLKKA